MYTRLGRPSSLAASPIVERLAQAEENGANSPLLAHKLLRQRRSLPQVIQQLEATASTTPRLNRAVFDRAADAIVYDLVNLDSPAVPSTCLIDPNSSFGILVAHF